MSNVAISLEYNDFSIFKTFFRQGIYVYNLEHSKHMTLDCGIEKDN